MDETKVVESSAESLESLAKPHGRGRAAVFMFSAAAALKSESRSPREIIRHVGKLLFPGLPATSWFAKLSSKVVKHVPEEYRDRVTERRMRGIHNGDARRVEWYEVQALLQIEAIEEARREHRDFVARTSRLATAFAATGEALSREELALLARLQSRSAALAGGAADTAGDRDALAGANLRGVDRARTGGDAR